MENLSKELLIVLLSSGGTLIVMMFLFIVRLIKKMIDGILKELAKSIKNNEIDHFFSEIFKYKTQCKFNDCKHINEPGCAVKPAVEEKKIPLSRYKSYLLLIEELQNDNNTTYR